MTKRQREVFAFIVGFIAERGYVPSFREIGDGIGVNSLASVQKHIQTLQSKGLITFRAFCSRSIEITPKGRRASKLQTANSVKALTEALREFVNPENVVPTWVRNRALEVLKETGANA
jgi:SOS-response transcriptional repressor LexA